jgi:hypothetical protein
MAAKDNGSADEGLNQGTADLIVVIRCAIAS